MLPRCSGGTLEVAAELRLNPNKVWSLLSPQQIAHRCGHEPSILTCYSSSSPVSSPAARPRPRRPRSPRPTRSWPRSRACSGPRRGPPCPGPCPRPRPPCRGPCAPDQSEVSTEVTWPASTNHSPPGCCPAGSAPRWRRRTGVSRRWAHSSQSSVICSWVDKSD